MKTTPVLLALMLLLGACANDGDVATDSADTNTDENTNAASSDTESSEGGEEGSGASADDDANATAEDTDADTDDAAADSDDSSTDPADDDATEDDSTDPPGTPPGFFVTSLLGQMGIEDSDAVLGCIEDRGIDLDLDPVAATEREIAEITVAIFGCAPDELAASAAAGEVVPEGLDPDDLECVMGTTFRYIGELPTDEAIAALESTGSQIPDEHRGPLIELAKNNCGLDEDVIIEILES